MRILTKMVLLALASSASGMALAADDDVVTMYGMGMPFYDIAKESNATTVAPANRPSQLPASAYTGLNQPSRERMTVGTSNWGFRGSENLGGGWRAVFQMESAFQIDQNNGPGLGGRDTKVGVFNPRYGELFMGQWDTPFKIIALPTNPIRGGYDFDRNVITGNPGMGVPQTTTQFTRAASKADASFDRRQGNSVQYVSPNWGGFTFRLQHSVDEGMTQTVANGPFIKPVVQGAFLQYDYGTLSLRYGYDEHKDYFGLTQIGGSAAGTNLNPHSKDDGNRFVGLWTIANTRITAQWERLRYRNSDSLATAINQFQRDAWLVVLEQRFSGGRQSIWGGYGRANDGSCSKVNGSTCVTSGIGAYTWNVGYIYRFSKKTEGYLYYYKVSNKESGTYNINPAVNAATAIAPGADVTGYGTGIQQFF